MSWLEALKERWLRGRKAGPPEETDAERTERVMTTPDADAQLTSVPDEQQNDVLDRSSDSSSAPDTPR